MTNDRDRMIVEFKGKINNEIDRTLRTRETLVTLSENEKEHAISVISNTEDYDILHTIWNYLKNLGISEEATDLLHDEIHRLESDKAKRLTGLSHKEIEDMSDEEKDEFALEVAKKMGIPEIIAKQVMTEAKKRNGYV